MVLDDLKAFGNPASNVINEQSWYYFPHVDSKTYAEGWYDKVEAMQGQLGTYYAGEVMCFGDFSGFRVSVLIACSLPIFAVVSLRVDFLRRPSPSGVTSDGVQDGDLG